MPSKPTFVVSPFAGLAKVMPMANPFLRKLRQGSILSEEDERTLRDLCSAVRQIGPHEDIFHEGDSPRHLTVVLEGWACRYKILENGRRQVITFFLPGDLCEPFGILPRFIDHSIGAVSTLTYAHVHPDQIKAAAQRSPNIEQALWWDALFAMSLQNERVVSLGRRQAVERVGHMFCELQARLELVGLADRAGFDLPLTQAEMADVLGISAVHVNRSLQELRSTGLITLKGRRLTIRDLKALQDLSLFDYAYMHMDDKGSVDPGSVVPFSKAGAR